MKNRLLIGPDAVNNLKNICDAYTDSVTRGFASRSSARDVSFHPVFGLKMEMSAAFLDQFRPWIHPTFRDDDAEGYIDGSQAVMKLNLIQQEMDFFAPKYEPLNLEEYLANQSELFHAIELIHRVSPWIGRLFDYVTYDVYFTKKNGDVRYLGGGGSTYRLLRLIFMSFRPHAEYREVEMAISLAHELGHNCFCLLQAGARPILDSSIEKEVYSGVRKIRRPSYASLQALVALAYMLSFSWDYYNQCDERNEPELKSFLKNKVIELHSDFEQGLNAFAEIKLTDLGKIVMFEFLELKNQIQI